MGEPRDVRRRVLDALSVVRVTRLYFDYVTMSFGEVRPPSRAKVIRALLAEPRNGLVEFSDYLHAITVPELRRVSKALGGKGPRSKRDLVTEIAGVIAQESRVTTPRCRRARRVA